MRVYDFAVGNPDPGSFPAAELAEATARVLERDGDVLDAIGAHAGLLRRVHVGLLIVEEGDIAAATAISTRTCS